ncbi:hypothetical protein ARTSIC4J27_3639 [Pseudarthrobacter siccitolerans]|uniref:Uncharacterized protein n=1 Tax=Pseudarthrobacter siccitolerans TaxID=861266 RepID=A0A024H7C5_9MICC|nr:hypothetical protein [Pseudarthrobacter siccitolerans]CCQ47646.1 hypothetical protein ARTSIC4J27_3639 [Pseudarthrobacter siccitolerans]
MTPHANVLPGLVDEMLLDAGFGQDDALRSALLSLGALASLPAPAPSGDLAALLAEDGGGSAGDELARRRWLRAHRPTVVGIALIAGMGMGAGGVAASSLPPGQPGSPSIQHLLKDWAPGWSLPVPQAAAGSVRPEAVPGSPSEAGQPADSGPEVSEAAGSPPSSGGAAEDPAVSRRGPAPAEIPAAPGADGRANGPARAGQGVAEGAGKADAGAAAPAKEGAAGQPEHAAGQGTPGVSDAPSTVVGAVPGVLAGVAGETLQSAADTAGSALAAVPGKSWLQKFNR